MAILESNVIQNLEENSLCTVVSVARYRLASRTMMYAYNAGKIYLLTANTTGKLDDMKYTDKGLLHIGNGKLDDMNSYDISIPGYFEVLKEDNPLFQEGYLTLAKKNPEVLGIMNSDMKNAYSLILFKYREIRAWTLLQALSGEEKTVIKV
ncbi:MAG: hypothetical protein A2Y33_07565 [Spirochaetes bacterium GWF1_51_8]|nr:MAG: hypothetical protein A2Y33_07565 [Spirochaetes bacterium GWF1_51_8]